MSLAPKKSNQPSTRSRPEEITCKQPHNHQGLSGVSGTSQLLWPFHPLNQVLAGKLRKLEWDMVQQSAFDRVKRALATATTLAFPHPDGSLSITTDASDTAIGSVLQTHHGNSTRPLAFFSKTLQQDTSASTTAIQYF